LELIIEKIRKRMEYEIVIRYENKENGKWEDVRVIVERKGNVDRNGNCEN
jgi:hypothetical protein